MSKKDRHEMVLDVLRDPIPTGKNVILSLVGRHPVNIPYLRIGLVDGTYIAATRTTPQLRKLAEKILEFLADEAGT